MCIYLFKNVNSICECVATSYFFLRWAKDNCMVVRKFTQEATIKLLVGFGHIGCYNSIPRERKKKDIHTHYMKIEKEDNNMNNSKKTDLYTI